jgi:hypothetical protein
LPIRFTTSDAAADERIRIVELDRDRVVLRRSVRGIRMAVKVPVAAFLGISLRVWRLDQDPDSRVPMFLEHRDPALRVPLLAASEGSDLIPEWHLWARLLGLPLLVANADGTLSEPFRRLGGVRVESDSPRRRRRHAVAARRPSIPLRRCRGLLVLEPKVHRGEREIIARS